MSLLEANDYTLVGADLSGLLLVQGTGDKCTSGLVGSFCLTMSLQIPSHYLRTKFMKFVSTFKITKGFD